MGLRDWAADAVENGGTLRWFLGFGIQIVIGGIAAVIYGWFVAHAVMFLFPLDAVANLTGGNSFDIVWASVSVALYFKESIATYAMNAN